MPATSQPLSPKPARPSWQSAAAGALLGGVTLGFIQIIVSVSFANLIFTGKAAQYLPYGIGAMLAGGLITMVAVSLTSSAPGTVSSIQDSPAVVLAVIGGALIPITAAGALLPTLLAAICISSLLTGATLWLLGHFRLGEIVRYIPYPVVGGFLAGTGLLLVIGGFTSMLPGPVTWATLPGLFQAGQIVLWGPCVVFALVMFFGMRLFKNLLALPGLILASIAVFYLALLVTGTSLARATEMGLLLGSLGSQPILHPPLLNLFAGVDWAALAAQSGHMVIIVMLNLVSLLLNVSGIELILDKEIDLNRELKSAGVSNLAAGLAGGPSGYHTPTFTALNKRLSGETRLPSIIGGALCGLTLLLGAGFLPFIPRMILGGLLLFLGLDFMNEWVIDSRSKLNLADYLVVIVIMLVVGFVGFLAGVGLGLLAMVAIFAVRYSRTGVLQRSVSGAEIRSNVERPPAERAALAQRRGEIFVMELTGFIFFGTAYHIQRRLKDRMADAQAGKLSWVILDFDHVTGLDSSGAQVLRRMEAVAGLAGFTLVFSGLEGEIERALGPSQQVGVFETLDLALEWCEEQILAETLGAERAYTLDNYLSKSGMTQKISLALALFFTKVSIEQGQALITAGEEAHELYFIQEGRVATYLEDRDGDRFRVSVMGPGTIVGEIGLYLNQKRSASVVAETDTVAYRLTDEALRRMRAEDAGLAASFDEFMVRILADRVLIASQRLSDVDH